MTSNQLQYWANAETKRSNLAKEREQARANRAQEEIGRRGNEVKSDANAINLSLGQRNADIKQQEATETGRSNLVKEQQARDKLQADIGLGYSNLAEQQRNNNLNYSLGAANLAEVTRSNQAREWETTRNNIMQLEEQIRSHKKSEEINKLSTLLGSSNKATEVMNSQAGLELQNEISKRNTQLGYMQLLEKTGTDALQQWNNNNRNVVALLKGGKQQ